jgi:OOP family OmpA-OmpF porin
MKPIRSATLKLACLAAGSLVASGAYAQFYAGVGVGQGHASSVPSVNTTVLGHSFTGEGDDDTDSAYKLYGGYQFTPNWGLEIGYNDLGNSYSVKGAVDGSPYTASYKMHNWYVAGTGTLPLGSGFSLLGKVGAVRNTADLGQVCAGGTCVGASGSDKHTDVLLGVGAQYNFMSNWAARLEYENYGKMTGDDVWGTGGSGAVKADAWYASVNYSF